MSLWIRSQNKENLINVNKIEIEYVHNTHKAAIWGNDVLLGIYSNKGKALKVLDMIEKTLTGTINVENIELNKLETLKEELKQNRTITTRPLENLGVFQMPHDDKLE